MDTKRKKMKTTYKFNLLKSIRLKDYGFGLFRLSEKDTRLFFKSEYGESYFVQTGEYMRYALGAKDDKEIENMIIIPIEY